MRLYLVLSFLFFLPAAAFPATILVPQQHATIQGAINSASHGDVILVSPGTYVENIDFIGKAIIVTSSSDPESTIIDGNQSGSVVTFASDEKPSSVLDGFTITNGSGDPNGFGWIVGGGIRCDVASPTIRNNIITGNRVDYLGGGIFSNASPVIMNNVIENNTAAADIAFSNSGGGISCWGGHPWIKGNTVSGNRVDNNNSWLQPTYGAGIQLEMCSALVENNDIHGNYGAVAAGGGIYTYDSKSTIRNNVIWNHRAGNGGGYACGHSKDVVEGNIIRDNAADIAGGGVWIGMSGTLVRKNVITGNRTPSNGGGGGGGIYCCYTPSPVINGNDIRGNRSHSNGGGIKCYNSHPLIMNNLIVKNHANGSGGFYWDDDYGSTMTLVNNTFCGNTARTWGGGIGVFSPFHRSVLRVKNCILWDNESPTGGSGAYLFFSPDSVISLDHCTVEDGLTGVKAYRGGTIKWNSGMIDQDPCFMDPEGNDFHLSRLSPCINRGTNDGAPARDMDGDPRPNMWTADMGCYEFSGVHTLSSDTGALPAAGGTALLTLQAGPGCAKRAYFVLGSMAGTAPGTVLPGGQAVLPLERDWFTDFVAGHANGPLFPNFFGTLDNTGAASSAIHLPASPGSAGIKLYFAYALSPMDFASNPVKIRIVP